MGYKRKPKYIRFTFADDTEYGGLSVTVRTVSLGTLLKIRAASADADEVEVLAGLVADQLVEWNLEEEDGTPIKPSREALLDQDVDFLMAIVTEWNATVAGVSAPLERPSTGGESSPEVSIPMAPLSESLAS